MTNTAVIGEIVTMVQDFMTYMLPIIAMIGGITFVLSFFMAAVFGMGRKTFKG